MKKCIIGLFCRFKKEGLEGNGDDEDIILFIG